MRKVFLGSIILLILIGCNQKSNSNLYDSKEQAILHGVDQEGPGESAVLSVEEYEGETIVFFEHADSFGVASITESKRIST